MLIDIAYLVGGFVLLIVGADYMVRGSVALARRLGISPMIIGMTVIATGTSLPELIVSLNAAVTGSVGLMMGNIVGSNIANILLILGAGALLSPIACHQPTTMRDGWAMMTAMTALVVIAFVGTIGLIEGLVGLIILFGYLYASYRHDQKNGADTEDVQPIQGSIGLALLAVVLGLAGVLIGADLLVDAAVELARVVGVSEEVIGLTLVAFGTSVPELATAIVAGIRRHADVALGNVLGSNLFNTLGIVGVTAMVVPIDVPSKLLHFDFWVMTAAGILLLVFMFSDRRLSRREGLVMLLGYFGFIAAQFFGVGEMVARAAFG